MSKFKMYKREQVSELRPVTESDIKAFDRQGRKSLDIVGPNGYVISISISEKDIRNGSPKIGDMIARNPKDHDDQWLINKEYFELNFEGPLEYKDPIDRDMIK